MENQKTILLIEDDSFTADLYQRQLEKEGFSVRIATHGIEALDIIKEQKPDLILLDIMLPKMDGFEFITRLHQEKSNHQIPIIILSNLDRESIIKEGFDLGAWGYIVKSSTVPAKVVEEVRKALEKVGNNTSTS